MDRMNDALVQEIVQTVLARLEHRKERPAPAVPSPGGGGEGVFGDVDAAVAATAEAQRAWARTPLATKARVIAALRATMHEHAEDFARRELEETGLGRYEDKIVKVHNAANSTPGLEDLPLRSWSGDKGLVTEEYAPYGVVAAITPSTHAVPVLFNSAVIITAPGNGAVFNVHPAAKRVSAYALRIFSRVITANGGPANLITMIGEPTVEGADRLFRHRGVRLIAATGGPGLVKAAFGSGKKVIAAGPGNPPVLVDETADLRLAATEIIRGASFDNNILCIAEKEAFVVASVYDHFLQALAAAGAVRLTKPQVQQLAAKAFPKDERGRPTVSRDFIGKNASVLARAAGVQVGDEVRLLFGEADMDCLFVQEEQMMPYLPVVRVRDADEGIAMAKKAEHGYGHTAIVHSNNLETITRFAREMDTSIVIVNGASFVGLGGFGGEGTFSYTISSPTGEGVCTPRHFARTRRLATYRTLRIT